MPKFPVTYKLKPLSEKISSALNGLYEHHDTEGTEDLKFVDDYIIDKLVSDDHETARVVEHDDKVAIFRTALTDCTLTHVLDENGDCGKDGIYLFAHSDFGLNAAKGFIKNLIHLYEKSKKYESLTEELVNELKSVEQ